MDKNELVAEWFRYANMDLNLAKHAFKTMHPIPLEIICYHCQQAAEKYLKGVIIFFEDEPEKTHDLLRLMEVLEKYTKMPIDFFELLNNLTQFAAKARYPQLILELDEDITKRAIAQAEQVKIWAETIIADKDEQADVNNDQ